MKKLLSRFGLLSLAAILTITSFSAFSNFVAPAPSASAGASTCTWTGAGADTNWSTADNWTCDSGVTPDNGTTIIFPYDNASADTTISNNDLSAANVYSGIEFSGTCIAVDAFNFRTYDITGNDIKMAGDIIADTPMNAGAQRFDCTPLFHAHVTMTTDGTLQRVNLPGELAIGSQAVTLTDTELENGGLTGSGTLTVTGFAGFDDHSASFTGSTIITSGDALLFYGDSLGSGSITIGTGGSFGLASSATVANNITVQAGASTNFVVASTQAGESFDAGTEIYGKNCDADETGCGGRGPVNVAFTGTLTLQQDAKVRTEEGAFTFSGAVVGNGHSLTLFDPNTALDGSFGDLVISAASNTSTTPNGTYHSTRFVTTLSDTNTNPLQIEELNTVILNGQRGDTGLDSTGILAGNGTTGALAAQGGGTIAPGNNGPGTLHSNNLNITEGGVYDVDLGGIGTGQYDQLDVTGTVSLGNQFDTNNTILNVHLINGYSPALNDTFTIVNNDGSDAVQNPFDNLAEGATFVSDGVTYTISYVGGDGNDVTLKATSITDPPNTAGVIAKPANIAIAGGIILVGAVLLGLRKKYLKAVKARS